MGKAGSNDAGRATIDLEIDEPAQRPRSTGFVIVWAAIALVTFTSLTALGIWQAQRLGWKENLIERVNQRVQAPPSPAPTRTTWPSINEQDDAYRHVRITGQLLYSKTTPVQTSTDLGQGFWLMTPLKQADGSLVMINRGFVTEPPVAAPPANEGPQTITGLLRLSQTGGGVMRDNNPAEGHWYSRDIAAIAAARGLPKGSVAPYFIDSDANATNRAQTLHALNQVYREPVGGLTVISFYNHHLQYAITWFILALMVAAGSFWVARDEWKVRKRYRSR